MDQLLTYKKGHLGPVFNLTIYIYGDALVKMRRFWPLL